MAGNTYKDWKAAKKINFPKNKMKCSVCNKSFTSASESFDHHEGKAHKKKVRKFMEVEKVKKQKSKMKKMQMECEDGTFGIGKKFLKQ